MRKTNEPRPLVRCTVIGLAVALTCGLSDARAQTRAGSDGRALDANQQVGSGGYNPDDGRLDFSRQNDVITGNVGGGRAFQDDVGYGAVGEFRDNLGSNTLFNFRAQSLSSSPSYLNATSLGGVGAQSNFRVFRDFTNRVGLPQSPGLLAPQGGGYVVDANGALTSIYSGQINTRVYGESLYNRAPGTALQAFTSSPSLGLNGQPVITSEDLSRRLYEDAQEAGEYQGSVNETGPMSFDASAFDPFGKTTRAHAGSQDVRPGQVPPTMLIGQQLQTLINPSIDAQTLGNPARSQQVLDSVFQRLPSDQAQADDEDVYVKLLRDIRGGKKQAKADAWTDALEAPTSQQLTEAERAYDDIMKEMYGEDYKTYRTQAQPTQAPDAKQGEAGEDVQGVVDQLNYDLPRLETLAANKKTRIADLTREAEAAMANGKYLTAESRYRQVILDTKDDPLPQAGLVHAQLGAGMFRSAAMNLRALFAQHPELIAVRYDAKLLPPQERLQWIQQELQTVISQGEGDKDAPLLLAYLGYQADARQVVRYGLALAQVKSPRDPLLAVVREIWLDESDNASSDGE